MRSKKDLSEIKGNIEDTQAIRKSGRQRRSRAEEKAIKGKTDDKQRRDK
jgi:hypothetical protein